MTSSRTLPLFRPGWVIHYAPAALAISGFFALGTLRAPNLGAHEFTQSDKVGHFIAVGLISWTLARALDFVWAPRKSPSAIWSACGTACAIGGLLEVVQSFLPHRSADWWDLLADCAGACAVSFAYRAARRGAPGR